MSMPATNDRAVIGDNRPPSPIDMAREALADLNLFLTNTPVVETVEQAKSGALFVERTRKSLQDMEDARKAETAPLNEAAKAINERYRTAMSPIAGLLNELRTRLTDYAAKEEARRIRAAEEARLRAEALEMDARRAEEAEREAKTNATFGEIVDVAEKVVEADQAFSRFQKADRAAAVAERDSVVRLPSQLGGKALSLRVKETLIVDNALKAISEIGSHPKINEAIASAAREYRRQYGRLPSGVRAETTREI